MISGSIVALVTPMLPDDTIDWTRLGELIDAFDFEPICFANVPQDRYDYMARAGDSEWTKRRNRLAFDWVELVERPERP